MEYLYTELERIIEEFESRDDLDMIPICSLSLPILNAIFSNLSI